MVNEVMMSWHYACHIGLDEYIYKGIFEILGLQLKASTYTKSRI